MTARRAWPKVYVVSVEDPFDVSDNCARTIHPDRIARIAGAFGAASEALLRATDSAGAQPSHQTSACHPKHVPHNPSDLIHHTAQSLCTCWQSTVDVACACHASTM